MSRKRGPDSAYALPQTRVASRAAIFGDSNDDRDETAESAGRDREIDTVMLNSLFDRLNDSIILDNDNSTSTPAKEPLSPSHISDDTIPVFRLFAKTPATIITLSDPISLFTSSTAPIHVPPPSFPYIDPEFDDADPSRLRLMSLAATTAERVFAESRMPWPRQFFAGRVTDIPLVESPVTETKRKRKSKKRRDFEKRVASGEVKRPVKKGQEQDADKKERWQGFGKGGLVVVLGGEVGWGTDPWMGKPGAGTGRGGTRGRSMGGRNGAVRGRGRRGDSHRGHRGSDV